MTNDVLLCSGMVGNDDLTLLQRSSSHPLMAERAQLLRVGRHHHFQIFRMIRTGRRRHISGLNVSPSSRPMADLAFYDLTHINAVVDAIGPFSDLLGMARDAICVAFVSRLLGGDLGYQFSPI